VHSFLVGINPVIACSWNKASPFCSWVVALSGTLRRCKYLRPGARSCLATERTQLKEESTQLTLHLNPFLGRLITDQSNLDYFPFFDEPCGREVCQVGSFQGRSYWRSQKRSWEDEVPLASLRCWQTAKWCVAKCTIPFGPRCARVILFSTIANYCHSQKAVNKSLSWAVRGCRLLIQSQ
jgi:hypothetical protein